MSELFPYICTRSTADPYIPPATANMAQFSRDVSDAFVALSGGYYRVGQISFYPLQRKVDSHLLCDGKEVAKTTFPELYAYLGDTQGTPADAANFVLPDFIGGTFTPAATADPETVTSGTVSTPVGTSEPEYYGDADSGGRRLRPGELEP